MVKVDRMPVRILGCEIGTATDWDEGGSMCSMQFYNFKPADGVAIDVSGQDGPVLFVDYDADLWELYGGDDSGDVVGSGSLVALVMPIHITDAGRDAIAEHTGG